MCPGREKAQDIRVKFLLRDKVQLTTDPEARFYKRATADKSLPSYQRHALMENRNGLAVAAEASQSATNAERDAALRLLDGWWDGPEERNPEH
jgi:hypothetical protein